MKFFVGLLFAVLANTNSFAQKHDNVWMFGYTNVDGNNTIDNFTLSFDTFPPQYEYKPGKIELDNYSGICDSSGLFQLYTNRCFIADENGEIIENADTLTTAWEIDWCNSYGSCIGTRFSLILPSLDQSKADYIVFTKDIFRTFVPTLILYGHQFHYHQIKKNEENDYVVIKERQIIQGLSSLQLSYGEITAVKHGNGRDWWLPIITISGDSIYSVLYAKDTIYKSSSQKIGTPWVDYGSFQASFSQDGSRFARYNSFQGLYLYDFDRCSGLFSNPRYYPIIDTTQGATSGVHFSPDNKLLYLADYDYLYQLDLEASDVLASKTLVATYDGPQELFKWKFGYLDHGPDGRIYVTPPGGSRHMNVINRPNLKGSSCDMQQAAYEFPYYYTNSPNIVNFRLGPLDGSPCDTLGYDNKPLANFRSEPSDTSSLGVQFWEVSAYEPTQWYWEFGDLGSGLANTSTEKDPVHQYPGPGFYTACLTVSNANASDSKCKVVEIKVSGTGVPFGTKGVWGYPNPSTGQFYIAGLEDREITVRVFDTLGKNVLTTKTLDSALDVNTLNNGVYMLHLSGDHVYNNLVLKLVIQK